MIEVRTAARADRESVAHVLGAAFRDDPVVRWLLPHGRRIDALFRTLATHQHGLDGGTDLAEIDGRPVGASLWDAPNYRQTKSHYLAAGPSFLRILRSRVRHGDALESTFHRNRPPQPFWYLASIGAAAQGRGVGSRLLEHRLAAIDGPAYLESSNEANIGLYERFGFRVTGTIQLPFGGPTCWPMWRD